MDLISYTIDELRPVKIREAVKGSGDECGSTFLNRSPAILFLSTERILFRYPNEIVFKNRGRRYTVFVDRCKDVDISGTLQAYIDCGAFRYVRAVGADKD